MVNYGDFVSQVAFEKILAESKTKNEVVQRALYDTEYVDYTSKSLDLRNNPWFFAKNYSYTERPKDGVYALQDDEKSKTKADSTKS